MLTVPCRRTVKNSCSYRYHRGGDRLDQGDSARIVDESKMQSVRGIFDKKGVDLQTREAWDTVITRCPKPVAESVIGKLWK